MSWSTDAPQLSPRDPRHTAALLLRGGAVDHGGAPRPWVPASWPDPGANPQPGSGQSSGAPLPALSFGENELAKAAAACAAGAARDARAACAGEAATAQALALERMAVSLTNAVQTRDDVATQCQEQVIGLAQAIARALIVDTDHRRTEAIVDTVRAMLATLPNQPTMRIVVASGCATALRAALPEIAGRLGCDGALEVAGDERLPVGAVQLVWPGGWLEHTPAAIQQRLAGLLTSSRATAASTTALIAPVGVLATDDGDEHGHG